MSTDSAETGDGDGPAVGPCRNAEEYAIELLESTDGPVTPAQAAEGHGCTPGYMQDVLRESDETVRVDIGEYALSTAETTEGADMQNDVESETVAPFEAPPVAGGEDTETERPSVDGPAQSEGRGGEAGDLEDGDDSDDESEEIDVDEDGDDDRDDGDGSDVVPVEQDEPMPEPAGTTDGIPIPVSTTTLFAGVGLALVVMLWYSNQSGDESAPAEETSQGADSSPFVSVEGFI